MTSTYRHGATIAAFFGLLVFLCLPANASPDDVYISNKTTSPPTLDGMLDDHCWQQAASALLRRCLTNDTPAAPAAVFMLVHDDVYLYFAATIYDTTPIVTGKERDDKVWNDDCFEIYLKPDSQPERYFELDFNRAGVAWDSLWLPFDDGERRTLSTYTAPSLQSVTTPDGDHWRIEGRIAFADLPGARAMPPRDGDRWSMGVNYLDAKQDRRAMDVYVWQDAAAIEDISEFGSLEFRDDEGRAAASAMTNSAQRLLESNELATAAHLAEHMQAVRVASSNHSNWEPKRDGKRYRQGYGRFEVSKDDDRAFDDLIIASPVGGEEATVVTIKPWQSGRLMLMARLKANCIDPVARGLGDGVWLTLTNNEQHDVTLRAFDEPWKAVVVEVTKGKPVTLTIDAGPTKSMTYDRAEMRIAILPATQSSTNWQPFGKAGTVQPDHAPLRPTGRAWRIDATPDEAGIHRLLPHDKETKLYKVTGWIKTDLETSTFAHIGIDYLDSEGKLIRQAVTRSSLEGHLRWGLCNVIGKTPWKRHVGYAYDMPPETQTVRLWVGVNSWENPAATGSAWFEDVHIEALTADANYEMRFPPTVWQDDSLGPNHEASAARFSVSTPSYLTYHLPEMPAASPTQSPEMHSVGLPGWDEAATLVVHANEALSDVSIKAVSLKHSQNADVQLNRIKVEKVRYLQRKRDKMSHEYLWSPTFIEQIKDDAKLAVAAGESQQFWFTVDVPENATPGTYQGSVQLTVDGKQVDVPWAFDVMPVKPDPVTDTWLGFYSYYLPQHSQEQINRNLADMKSHGMTSTFVFYPGIQMPIEKADSGELKIIWNEENHLANQFDFYKEQGFTMPLLLIEPGAIYDAAVEHGGPLGSDGFARVYRELFSQFRAEHERRGWPDVVIAPYDEGYPYPFTDHRFDRTEVCAKLLREMGFTIAVHSVNLPTRGGSRFNEQYHDLFDMILLTYCFPPVTMNETFRGHDTFAAYRDAMRRRDRNLLVYNVDATGQHPEAMRFSYGIGLWLQGADGIINWHYDETFRRSPYPIWRRQGYTNMNFVYPPFGDETGGPTIGWEATREGVKDYALLRTLDRLLDSAPAEHAKPIRAQLQQWVRGIDFSKINSTGSLALPGNWPRQSTSPTDQHLVHGQYKIPIGFSLSDYDAFRRWVCYKIAELENLNR